MPRTSVRSLARSLVASNPALETVPSPEPAKPDREDETAAVAGAPVDDRIVGTAGRDVISARDGDDLIRGLEGEDRI